MPRIRQLAEQYKSKDFWNEIAAESSRNGMTTNAALAKATGVDPKSVGNYRDRPETMQVKTMRKFVELLKPDIKTVLLFIGYSEKDIRGFVRENAN